jgi:drug/metabolite transporter (DMT)-like permease
MTKNKQLPFIFIILLLFLNMASGVLIKISAQYHANYYALAVVTSAIVFFYLLRTLVWLFLGKYYQLSYVYPFIGLNYILSVFVGVLFFDEDFQMKRLIGSILILCGVLIITRSKHQNDSKRLELQT